jgi:hypothetical protein
MKLRLGSIALTFVSLVLPMTAQSTSSQSAATIPAATQPTHSAATTALVPTAQVPRLVKLSGTILDINSDATGNGVAGRESAVPARVVGVTFSLYSEQTGGVPLWSEVQNVQIDETGHYTVQLGSTQAEGLPLELFNSAQAQWLGVQQEGHPEQPRIMLLSVPYALKAADAETFGGKPPSAYVAARQSDSSVSTPSAVNNGPASNPRSSGHPLFISGSGTTNYIPLWTSASNLASSSLWQASNGWITLGDQTPIAPLAIVSSARGALYVHGTVGNTYPIVQADELDTTSQSPVIEGITNSSSTGMAVYGSAQSSTGGTVAVEGANASSTGAGVVGKSTATTGMAYGVQGSSTSTTGIAVAGLNTATSGQNSAVLGQDASPAGTAVQGNNLATTGNALGVVGQTASAAGIGSFGIGVGQSDEGGTVTLRPIGVWGDTNQSSGIGVLASADFGIAFAGYNDAENISTAKFQNDESTDESGNILATHGGHFGGICVMDVAGNLGCTGSKSAVVPVDGGTRKVALYAVEAPENWFEDFGSALLSQGSAIISLESVYAQTVDTGLEYHVFLTPKGDCKGLYVTNERTDSFEVRELGGGTANIAFDYRIVARRKGYETIRLADRTKQFNNAVNEPAPTPGKPGTPKLPHSLTSKLEQK